jgi:hypothetical protein
MTLPSTHEVNSATKDVDQKMGVFDRWDAEWQGLAHCGRLSGKTET